MWRLVFLMWAAYYVQIVNIFDATDCEHLSRLEYLSNLKHDSRNLDFVYFGHLELHPINEIVHLGKNAQPTPITDQARRWASQ